MGVHKLSAGSGYTYLTSQVAAHDATDRPASLEAYYSEKGESPGVWVGTGVNAFGLAGTAVSEAQMKALFGEGVHPDADRIQAEMTATGASAKEIAAAVKLGREFTVASTGSEFPKRLAVAFAAHNVANGRPARAKLDDEVRAQIRTRVARDMFAETYHRPPADERELSGWIARNSRPDAVSVAGFDFTFSPVKTVSSLWAVAPRETAAVIEAAHHDAIGEVLDWFQANAAYTRQGAAGVRQVEIRGVSAAMFTHRDSRAGDPDLHTHVAVSNKVQNLAGKWLTLDGRAVYKANVTMSEMYTSALERRLTERLGVRFADRDPVPVDGKRSVREIAGVDPDLASFWSSRRLMIDERRAELAARFQTDQGRTPTAIEAIALAQQATLETRQAKHEPRSLAEQRATWAGEAAGVLGPGGITRMLADVASTAAGDRAPVTGELVDQLTARVLDVVSTRRSVWSMLHVRAEADRQVRVAGVDPAAHVDLVDRVVAKVLDPVASITLNPATRLPAGVLEPASLQRSDGASQYSVWASTLYTSETVLAAEARIVAAAGRHDGRRLDRNAVGIALLEQEANGPVLNSGQAQLVDTFATSGARVQLALAPAGTGKTTAMRVLTRAWTQEGGTVVGLSPTAAAANELAASIGQYADTLDKLVWHLDNPHRATPAWMARIGAGSLVIVDEAGLASTRNLDTAISWIIDRGGSVRLIGDDAQLASVAAGGVLRDIASAHGALTLTDVVRFADPAEGPASLALRGRDPAALGFYLDRGRVHVGDPSTTLGAAYAAWAADRERGIDSVMMAGTHEQVSVLNAQARADRLAAEGGQHARAVTVRHGLAVSAGDTIVTKTNNRRLTLGESDFVRNGYRFTVRDVADDGSLTAVQIGTNRVVTLPADYVAGDVLLGYAVTFDSAQGLTIGSRDRAGTAHTVIDPSRMSTQQLYESVTRAVTANHLYVQVVTAGGEHDAIHPDSVSPKTGVELLTSVLARDGAQVSAHTAAATAANATTLLPAAAGQYADALGVAAETILGPARLATIETAAETAVPGVTAAPAWATLRAHLALFDVQGGDPIGELASAVASRSLGDADDPAAVLDWRLDPTHQRGPAGPLPWLHAIPTRVADNDQWGPYLAAIADRVETLAGQVDAQARAWADPVTGQHAPVWARPLQALDVHPALLGELAVWRYGHDVDDIERRATGPTVHPAYEHTLQARLEDQVAAAGYLLDTAAAQWTALAGDIHPGLVEDPFWPVLATRLTHADAAGANVAQLVADAAAQRPLPDEYPAAALWYRLVEYVGDVGAPTSSGLTLRPAWSGQLDQHLGEETAVRVMAAPAWPAVVARIDAAARAGADPDTVFAQALVAVAPTASGPGQLAEAVLWHVALLTDPAPTDADLTPAVPDPADADREAPHDLHLLPALDRAVATVATPTVAGDDAWWDTLPEPSAAQPEAWTPTQADQAAATGPVVNEYAGPAALDPIDAAIAAIDWADVLDALTPAPLPYPDLTPAERVDQLRHDLDQARGELATYRALIDADQGPHLLAAQPVLADMRARRDAVADLEADHRGAYADWIDADRTAETTAAALDAARARLAVVTSGGEAADPEQLAIADAGVFLAQAAAAAAAAWAGETHQTYRGLDAALTAAAGPAGVIRTADVDHARLIAHSLDDAHTSELREKVTTVSDQLFRAENYVARYDAAGVLITLTDPVRVDRPADVTAAAAEPTTAAVAVIETPATERWADLAETAAPGVTDAPGWTDLAAALGRLDAAGYDVAQVLPATAASAPLPTRPANELTYRLYETYAESSPPLSDAAAAALYQPTRDITAGQQDYLDRSTSQRPDTGIDR